MRLLQLTVAFFPGSVSPQSLIVPFVIYEVNSTGCNSSVGCIMDSILISQHEKSSFTRLIQALQIQGTS